MGTGVEEGAGVEVGAGVEEVSLVYPSTLVHPGTLVYTGTPGVEAEAPVERYDYTLPILRGKFYYAKGDREKRTDRQTDI